MPSRADPLGHRAAVAGDERDVAHALSAQQLRHRLGLRPEFVGERDHAGQAAVDGDEYSNLARSAPGAGRWARWAPSSPGVDAATGEEAAAADGHAMAVYDRGDALSRMLLDVGRRLRAWHDSSRCDRRPRGRWRITWRSKPTSSTCFDANPSCSDGFSRRRANGNARRRGEGFDGDDDPAYRYWGSAQEAGPGAVADRDQSGLMVWRREVRWSAVAEANGRVAHPAMEWAPIIGAYRYLRSDSQQPGIWDRGPRRSAPAAAARAPGRRPHPTHPHARAWYAIWEGFGDPALLGESAPAASADAQPRHDPAPRAAPCAARGALQRELVSRAATRVPRALLPKPKPS